MRTLFIQNNGIQESIGIANMAGILKANGHEVDLLLLSHTPDLIGAIRKYDPQLIALSGLTGTHQSLFWVATQIKEKCKVPVIMGGPHPTYSPGTIEHPAIDIICRGEGELAILELADKMERSSDIRSIRNLYVKEQSGTIWRNDLRPPVPLDELPLPDREIYYKYKFLRDVPMKRFIASMGCPYPCTFCHEPVISGMYRGLGKYFRRKSSARVVKEILYIKDRYPLKHVHFSDDLFFIRNSYGWLEEFAELYQKEIGIPYCCNLRYDSIDEKSVTFLKKSNAYGVAVGLESGNEHLREVVIRKRSKNEHIIEGARLLRKNKIKVLTTNMIGLPGETLDQAFETVELNMRLKSDYTRATTFLLFPGLPMVEYAKRNGYIDENFDIDKHVSESMEINLKTPYAKEFRNIASLFWIFSKCPKQLIPLFRKIVKIPDNALFRLVGAFNMMQELLFYRINPIAGMKYFINTVLMTRKSGLNMTIRSFPAFLRLTWLRRVFGRRAGNIVSEQQIWDSDRGYF